MYPFIETLRIVNGEICNLSYHQVRMERTLSHFWPLQPHWLLEEVLQSRPTTAGVYKARVVYDDTGVIEVEYTPYTVRTIRSLKLVDGGNIAYTYKSTDRRELQALVAQKGEADEIIIVKDGFLTDTSYSNIALYDGQRWVTPRVPLLRGTMRQSLLDAGVLTEADIRPEEMKHYQKIALINAMMPLGVCEVRLM